MGLRNWLFGATLIETNASLSNRVDVLTRVVAGQGDALNAISRLVGGMADKDVEYIPPPPPPPGNEIIKETDVPKRRRE